VPMIRFLTAGESHGPALVTIVEGLPSGLEVTPEGLAAELGRRRAGYGRGGRMAVEADEVEIVGGVRFGRTLGGPVAVLVRNSEWPNWQKEMSPLPGHSEKRQATPRPGHADLAGMLKYDTHDARDVLERASARETAARTVAGHLAKGLLGEIGVILGSHVVAVGPVTVTRNQVAAPGDLARVDESPLRTLDPIAEVAMLAEVDRAMERGDTLGGVAEVLAFGLPPGVGSHTHWDRRLDGMVAGALMSIPGVKGVEIGDGFVGAGRPGSEAHDEIEWNAGRFGRVTARAGGIEGGMSTGEILRARIAMKPLPTLAHPLSTVDVETKLKAVAFRERSDTCAVPAAGVVAEAMLAPVLAGEVQRMFGGDTVMDLVRSAGAYRQRLAGF
jgi:chorismate synthase